MNQKKVRLYFFSFKQIRSFNAIIMGILDYITGFCTLILAPFVLVAAVTCWLVDLIHPPVKKDVLSKEHIIDKARNKELVTKIQSAKRHIHHTTESIKRDEAKLEDHDKDLMREMEQEFLDNKR